MATNAERLRRHRAHHRGDHSLCRPERGCAPAASAPDPAPERYPERTPGAQALWDELAPHLGAAHRVLLTQVCRIADRLDRLDALIDGRHRRGEWLRLTQGEDGELRVVVDDLLAESRQQATALRGLVAEVVKGLPKAGASTPGRKGGGLLDGLVDELAAKRRQGTSG